MQITPLDALRHEGFFSGLMEVLTKLPNEQGRFSGKSGVKAVRDYAKEKLGIEDRAWVRRLIYLLERKRILGRDKINWFVLGNLEFKPRRTACKHKKRVGKRQKGKIRREVTVGPEGEPRLKITAPKPKGCGHKELKDFSLDYLRAHFPKWFLKMALNDDVHPSIRKLTIPELAPMRSSFITS